MIILWKNDSWPDLMGEKIELFKVTWTGTKFVKDPDGKWWGMEHPNGRRNVRLKGPVEDFGNPVEVSADIEVPSIVTGRPTLGIVDEEEDNYE
jgi:hypothetical protein